MSKLPPRFAKIVGLMDSSTFEHGCRNARERAEKIASEAGSSFEAALALTPRAHLQTPPQRHSDAAAEAADRARTDAKEAAAREQAHRARVAKIAPIVAKYGSEELAIAPCRYEERIRVAVAPWLEPCEAPHQRWTRSLGGFTSIEELPERILDAIANAYPLPMCFADAKKEFDYWTSRERDLAPLVDPAREAVPLDLCATFRYFMIAELYSDKLPVENIDQLFDRYSVLENVVGRTLAMLEILKRDIAHLQSRQEQRSEYSRAKENRQDKNARIDDFLRRDPLRSDRDVAREVGCSPTTVGKRRHATGVVSATRTIKRGGRTFDMRVRG